MLSVELLCCVVQSTNNSLWTLPTYSWYYYIGGAYPWWQRAVLHRQIGLYNADKEKWENYSKTLEYYFAGNAVDDDGWKKAILLTVCGMQTFWLIRTLAAPTPLTEKSNTEVRRLLNDHFNLKPAIILQRFRFNNRVRQPAETVATFMAVLRQIAEDCDLVWH